MKEKIFLKLTLLRTIRDFFFSFLPNYRNRHAMVYNLYPPLPRHNFYLDYASLEDDINEFDFVKQAIL